jgi:hypothetical protein
VQIVEQGWGAEQRVQILNSSTDRSFIFFLLPFHTFGCQDFPMDMVLNDSIAAITHEERTQASEALSLP